MLRRPSVAFRNSSARSIVTTASHRVGRFLLLLVFCILSSIPPAVTAQHAIPSSVATGAQAPQRTALNATLPPGLSMVQLQPEAITRMALTGADAGVIEAEPNGNAAIASPISGNPVKLKGALYPNGDIDFYSFSATAGSRVYAATMTSGSAGSSTDSQLTLLAADGITTIEFDDDNGSFATLSSSIAGATIPTDGTYFLRVSDFTAGTTSERSYELYLSVQNGAPTAETESNDTPAIANPLPASGWVSGTRSPAAATEQDWYSLNLNAGDTVFLSLDVNPERDGTVWNGRLGFALFGDAANQIVVVDDAGTGDVAPIPNNPSEALFMTVKNAGTYFAFVDSASAAVGGPTATYNLNVSVIPKQIIGTNCTTYTSTNVPQTIGPGTGLTSSTITVPGNPRIADIDVEIVLSHALMQDIDAHLRSPAGNDNGLFTDIGAAAIGGQTQMDVVFDDEAAIPPTFTVLRGLQLKPENNSTAGTASTSGAYRLAAFYGENAGGTWTLDLRDDTAGANGGTLTSWALRICEPPPPPDCPIGFTQITVFSTDFEGGAAGFTHSGAQDEWELGLPATLATTTANPVAAFNTCNSGVNCWKTDLDNTYNASSNQDLLSPNINLAGLSAPVIVTWAQRHQIETANFDHMFVDFQQVGGATPVRLYDWMDPTPISASAGTGNPQANIGGSYGWAFVTKRADSLAGLNSELRFHLDSDTTVNFGGLAIDDVTVSACRPIVTDLSVTKSVNPLTAIPGQPITYTLRFANAGPDTATSVVLTDTIPISVTNLNVTSSGATITDTGTIPAYVWQVQNLAPAQSGIITITGQLDPSIRTSGTFTNTATIRGVGDSALANNSAAAPLTVTLVPEITLIGNNVVITSGDTTPSATDDTDYGSLPLGQAITHTFTISNSGLAALNLTNLPPVVISGANAADFSVVTSPATPVAAPGTSTFAVRFIPSITGLRTATITIANNDTDEPSYTFAIQGTGTNTAPIADAGTPQSVAPSAFVTLNGSTSSDPDGHLPLTYRWTQIGGTAVVLSNTSVAQPTFTAPAATGALTFTLTVTDSFGLASTASDTVVITVVANPPNIVISGNGVPITSGDTTPSPIDGTDFGSHEIGQLISQTFTISNTGGSDLQLSGMPLVAISGANASDFSVVVEPNTPVTPGGATNLTLRFAPQASGLRSAIITILNNDGDSNAYTFTVQGNATAPVATNVYLPIVSGAPALPDLVIESLSVSNGRATIVIKNIGNATPTDAFWVDLYLNPSQPPQLNQPWQAIAAAGSAWGVTGTALQQLSPGGTLTLVTGDAYYASDYSSNTAFPTGAQVYVLVDSINLASSYGGVAEQNETNNRFGPVIVTSGTTSANRVALPALKRTGLPAR
jgi:uncharacterized repeat protein (TIGR01451 family)